MQNNIGGCEGTEQASKRRRLDQAERGRTSYSVQEPGHQHGHSYASNCVGGQARLHQGDNVNIVNYYGQRLQDMYDSLPQSLIFERIDARLRNPNVGRERSVHTCN